MKKAVFVAAFLAIATAVPAGAQELGLWQNRIGEGIAYGEPRQVESLAATDPVAALPISPRPPARAAARVAAPAAPTPTPAAAKAPQPAVAPPAVVSDLMMQGYNPDLPLPHPDLEGVGPGRRVSTSPRPYIRGDEHGAVFGLTMPLGANRIPLASKNTRYGVGGGSAEIGFGSR